MTMGVVIAFPFVPLSLGSRVGEKKVSTLFFKLCFETMGQVPAMGTPLSFLLETFSLSGVGSFFLFPSYRAREFEPMIFLFSSPIRRRDRPFPVLVGNFSLFFPAPDEVLKFSLFLLSLPGQARPFPFRIGVALLFFFSNISFPFRGRIVGAGLFFFSRMKGGEAAPFPPLGRQRTKVRSIFFCELPQGHAVRVVECFCLPFSLRRKRGSLFFFSSATRGCG